MSTGLKPEDRALLTELGIPKDYGTDPELRCYSEATELVDVGPNIVGRMQRLTPHTADAWRAMQAAAEQDSIELVRYSMQHAWGKL